MAIKRTDKIIQRIEAEYRKVGKPVPNPSVVIDALNEVYDNLCRNNYALKGDEVITLEAGTELYDIGLKIHKIAELIEPTGWITRLEIVEDSDRWADIKRSQLTSSYPLSVMVWNGRLRFYPVPSTTGDEIEAFVYFLPDYALAIGNDPETDPKWDVALKYGVLSILLGADYELKYQSEIINLSHQSLKETTKGVIRHRHSIDDVGY